MIEELRHFVLIAELGNFTRAAGRAHLTQPALSAAIRRLERHMGARLLHRGRSGASLTAAGEALLPHALAAIAALEAGERAVAEVEGLRAGEVRVGAGATACTYLLPEILAVYRRAHPDIRFLLRETNTHESLDALHAGEIDIAIVSGADGEPWFVDELIIVAAPDFELGEPATIARAPFVAFRRGTTSRALLDAAVPDADIVMELGSIATVKGNVRAGIGLALVSRHAVVRDLAEGTLVQVATELTPIPRPLELVHLGVERLPPAAAALRQLLLSRRGRPPRRPRRARGHVE
ncbi:Hydrogen peroxide-inducible activator [Enhygromyxa salina]|uniref:Hydrogen peroxide-inducible activator n=1 Tax=Enhygromyxa salina TaxID=215803 RepID=A0A0C2D9I8_9BACT|nr:LysR substrate-binding domain-containing protein [Enhygromyxa salina]KIG16657.1 Hydrogen peroxide-inducible activator [Enhygromyxa salina]